MSHRNGVHGPRPRPHWPKSTILLHDAIILRVDMMNAARVGPEEALRGRDCCKGVGPTPTEEGEASRRSRHGVQRAHGPECACKNRRTATLRPKWPFRRCRVLGRTRSFGGATVGGAGDVDPLAALRGAQGGASYIIRGARVASMTRKRIKSCRFGDGHDRVPSPCRPESACSAAT